MHTSKSKNDSKLIRNWSDQPQTNLPTNLRLKLNISRLVIHVYSCILEYFRIFSYFFVTEILIRRRSNFGLAATRGVNHAVLSTIDEIFFRARHDFNQGFRSVFYHFRKKCSRTYQHEHIRTLYTNILDLEQFRSQF